MYITHRRWFDFVWLRYCAVDIELNFGRSHHWTKSLFPCCHSYLGAQFQLRGAIVCHSYRGDIPSYGRYYHGCARWSNHFLPGMLLGTCVVCLTPLAEVHIIGLWCSWTGRSYLYKCYRKKSPLGFVQNLRDALAGVSISWWWFTLDFSFSFFFCQLQWGDPVDATAGFAINYLGPDTMNQLPSETKPSVRREDLRYLGFLQEEQVGAVWCSEIIQIIEGL